VDEESTNLEDQIKGQGVFVSEYRHSLDPKRRLTIPSPWRAQIGEPKSLYVLPDVEHKCLVIFPASEMVRRLERLRKLSIGDTQGRQFARVLGSRSDLVSWDAQGRIRIKDELLNFAGIKEQVVLVGAIDRFELWNPDHLQSAGGMEQVSLLDAARQVGF